MQINVQYFAQYINSIIRRFKPISIKKEEQVDSDIDHELKLFILRRIEIVTPIITINTM